MAAEDLNWNKRVAFCSALCAGFAYVGYSVMSKMFFKSTPVEAKNKDGKCKLISKCIQTETPIISCDYIDISKSVKERVKDLNYMARHLRKTSIPSPSPERKRPSSLYTPWSSPLGCSKYLSYSAENISTASPPPSPEPTRRTQFHGGKSTECLSTLRENGKYRALSRMPLPTETGILKKTLHSLQKVPRKMTLFETRNIMSLLYSGDEDILVQTLTTVSNCAAFSSNQEQLCSADCPGRLYELLQHPSEAVKVATAQAISNIVAMEKGYYYFRTHIPVLFAYSHSGGELLRSFCLAALANLALNNSSHKTMVEDVNGVFNMIEDGSTAIQLQALRLLVNLSCNKEMIPFLLLTKVPPSLFQLIQSPNNPEIKLRLITFLANIITFATQDLSISAGNSTLIAFLYQMKEQSEFEHIVKLSNDRDHDISYQARRLCDALMQNQ